MENSKNLIPIYHVTTQEVYNSTSHPIADQSRNIGMPLDIPKSLSLYNDIHNNMNGMADFLFKDNPIHIITNGSMPNTLFCGPDVAMALGYNDPHYMYDILNEYEKVVIDIRDFTYNSNGTPNSIPFCGNPNVVFITLPGLFRVIAESKYPNAIKFQNWVYYIVLPCMWSFGIYIAPVIRERINNDPNLMYGPKLESENTDSLNKINNSESYTNTSKFIINNIQLIDIEDLAKILNSAGINMEYNRLFELLCEEGYLIKTDNDILPTQKSLDLGLITYNNIPLPNGNICILVYITPKGINYFINKYKDLR